MASRPIIRIPHPAASPTLRRALRDLRREFARAGLTRLFAWVRVEQIDRPPTAEAMGWYSFSRHTIRMPEWTPRAMRACARDAGSKAISLRAVLRHEFGHALFDLLRLEGDPGFRRFGRGESVTAYAETNAEEDFAETFMRFMTWRGRLRRRAGPALRAKWGFVRDCIGRVRRRRARRLRAAA